MYLGGCPGSTTIFSEMSDRFTVPGGLDEIRNELPYVVALLAQTARWVHPDTFRALPLWFPETARGRPMYDAAWTRVYKNKDRETKSVVEKREPNIRAGKAMRAALGASKADNWAVCHIWGVDDPAFQKSNRVVRDPRYYSCVGNMVWLPTPLKGFTDSMPEIKLILRTCAFQLYGWVCEHEDVAGQAEAVRTGEIPEHYPAAWPTHEKQCLPPGTAPYSDRVQGAIARRKAEIREMLDDATLVNYPRDEVREVLAFWKIEV
jgi:hypothetical protein